MARADDEGEPRTDRAAGQRHRREGAEHRHRDGEHPNERRSPALQEEENDQNHERDGEARQRSVPVRGSTALSTKWSTPSWVKSSSPSSCSTTRRSPPASWLDGSFRSDSGAATSLSEREREPSGSHRAAGGKAMLA